MVGRFVSRLSTIAAFFAISASAAAQTGSITGKVTDAATGRPLAQITVEAISGGQTVASGVTGEDGNYRLKGVAAGTYTVAVRKVGFVPERSAGVRVSAGAAATANFTMTEKVSKLEAVLVTPSHGAFTEKDLSIPASLSVVSSEQISAKPTATIAEYMKTLPGISVASNGLVSASTVSRGFNGVLSGTMLGLQDYRFVGVPSLRYNVPFLYSGTSEDIERIEVLNGPAASLY